MKWMDGIIGLAAGMIFAGMVLFGCGDPPGAPPGQLRGNLLVTGVLPNDSLPDSIEILMDDAAWGLFANPHLCEGVVAGMHLVEVLAREIANAETIEYSGAQQVIVAPDSTVDQQFVLLGLAPDFALTDIDGDTVSMSALRGKVVMLYFFHST
jgi:hypothetical protein